MDNATPHERTSSPMIYTVKKYQEFFSTVCDISLNELWVPRFLGLNLRWNVLSLRVAFGTSRRIDLGFARGCFDKCPKFFSTFELFGFSIFLDEFPPLTCRTCLLNFIFEFWEELMDESFVSSLLSIWEKYKAWSAPSACKLEQKISFFMLG